MRDDTPVQSVPHDPGHEHWRVPVNPRVAATYQAQLTAPLNAVTPLGATLPDNTGGTVDISNNINQGALLQYLPGVPPGPETRNFALEQFPDTGSGNLGFPALGLFPGKGTITPVDNHLNPIQSGATGIALAGGAYVGSLEPIDPNIDLSGGWAVTFSYQTPAGTGALGGTWVAIGRYPAGSAYGVTIGQTSSGALTATIADPRQAASPVRVQSTSTPRGQINTATLRWSASSGLIAWTVNGAASGAAVPLGFQPDIGTGMMLLGANLALVGNQNPQGAIYGVSFEDTGANQTSSYVPLGAGAALSTADALNLAVDTRGIFAPVAAAGDVDLSYIGPNGPEDQDVTIAFGGYVTPYETITSYIGGDMAYCPVGVGSEDATASALVLTPPYRGKIKTASTQLLGAGQLSDVQSDGTPPVSFLQFQPIAGGTGAGQNPNGSTTRGSADLIRTQQKTQVRLTNIIEMNRPARMNGGGECWGHATDSWVPFHTLMYGYNDGYFYYPTLDNETPTVTVTQVPGAGEGTIRVGRTGADLKVGDSVAWTSLKYLGWNKPGVSAVSVGCALGLTSSIAGGPNSAETYPLVITDAARQPAFSWWEEATGLYSDQHTRLRWGCRGGDWAGVDGLYGAQPFVTSPAATKAGTVTTDVTQMVKAGGTEFFVMPSSATASVSLVPGFYTPDPGKLPLLVVTGGARAGTYTPTRSAGIGTSDSSGFNPTVTTPFICKRGQPLLLAFDAAGALADATSVALVLTVAGVSSGGSPLQLFRPAPQTPRPGPRVSVTSTPTTQRADFLCKVDTNAEWQAMLSNADAYNRTGTGQPSNYTIANGCYYGGIPQGVNGGISLYRGFMKPDGTGYPVVRFGRMVGWHANYVPADADIGPLGVSGKSPGILATGSGSLSQITAGFGGRQVSGLGGYTMRMQRGGVGLSHKAGTPLAPYLAFGDYDYFISGNTNGLTTYAINPIPRMRWAWIETVHGVNSVYPDGTWAADGTFQLFVNGRKQCESHRLEWRVGGNSWLWDTIWYDEYNGGTTTALADRLWPFVIGPCYVVASADPIAPPANWNVPFVTAAGTPDTTPLAYSPDW